MDWFLRGILSGRGGVVQFARQKTLQQQRLGKRLRPTGRTGSRDGSAEKMERMWRGFLVAGKLLDVLPNNGKLDRRQPTVDSCGEGVASHIRASPEKIEDERNCTSPVFA